MVLLGLNWDNGNKTESAILGFLGKPLHSPRAPSYLHNWLLGYETIGHMEPIVRLGNWEP